MTMTLRAKAVLLGALMCGASALAVVATPTIKIADQGPKVKLEAIFPAAFDEWQLDLKLPVVLPSPDAQALLNKLYNQTLARTYVNGRGERIMLSVAYGGDQSEGMAIHRPEVCYPAQGFEMLASRDDHLSLAGRQIPIRRLRTRHGARVEPVTYWIVVGDKVPGATSVQQRLAQLAYGLRGRVPDGMLVRVSSLSADPQQAYVLQDRFLNAMVDTMAPDDQRRVLGSLAPM